MQLWSGRHWLPVRAGANRFIHCQHVDDHRDEHQQDGGPEPPVVMDRPFSRWRAAAMFLIRMLLLMRHARRSGSRRRELSSECHQDSLRHGGLQFTAGQAFQPDVWPRSSASKG
jgi:hypothetical protein